MKEGVIVLPEKIVDGIGLDRNKCLVVLLEESQDRIVKCSEKNKRTPSGCRSLMHPREPNYFHGCTLRDFPKPEYILERWGIALTKG